MKSFRVVNKWGDIMYKNQEGQFHREYGPAIIYTTGKKIWYNKGKLHCEDGPAVVYPDNVISFWLDDEKYSKEDWELELIKRKLQKIKDL